MFYNFIKILFFSIQEDKMLKCENWTIDFNGERENVYKV